MEESKTWIVVVVFIVILIILIGVVSWWWYVSSVNFNYCKNNESISCPTYFCANLENGLPGTKCVQTTNGKKSTRGNAFRIGETGEPICQKPTIAAAELNNL
jgi:hypothetical protein